MARADDGKRYWVKPLNNTQGPRVPITEQIVGRVSSIIGAPIPDVKVIEIHEDLRGWEFRPSRALEPGLAHAILHVDDALDTRDLTYRDKDENGARHVTIVALYDWCWGGDEQWLIAVADDHRYFSHDHGWYLPPTGADWSVDQLVSNVHAPHELSTPSAGLCYETAKEVAQNLRAVSRESIVTALAQVPSSWPVSDHELESVGAFLEQRAAGVAERLLLRCGAK